ncbi:hypothetical protein BS50DRAFT_569732 [Corynespora cassiicola Philippines]|uniref:Uncharacterized protein n=1 Tax=Corynespora cassiicola Philippines TaxID=1448308 RepID=A0A2T2P3B6_CORCC|nr:hypothetical protein BS50DRAFT_569732 [Corynespora cassiicola Philippines]
MASNNNPRTPNPSNPSALAERYEIRRLEPKHAPWAKAIVIHSNLFYSPLWPVLYPEKLTERIHRGFAAGDYLVDHQINSGLSFGVFDTQYQFKRPESAATDGKLYWDPAEPSIYETEGLEAQSKLMLEQMDFPLVSVALSYDAFHALDMDKMGPLMDVLPHFGLSYRILVERDTRDPAVYTPTRERELLFRNATSTRQDYTGERIMAAMARWLMREADEMGFRGIQIETVHDRVDHVWANPPEPYKGITASEFHTGEYVDEKGEKPFAPAQQRITKVFVELKPMKSLTP